jgi:membrane protein YqaA with SNARE-associated domain
MLAIAPAWKYIHSAALLIGLGIVDSSFIPLPGSLDALLIFYVSRHHQLWLYIVLMATAGSVAGGIITYDISRKGGEEALKKKLGKKAEKVFRKFSRWGFWSVLLGCMAPPPVPTSAFIAAAGALQYSLRRFTLAMVAGRFLRFLIVGVITLKYGQGIFHFFARYYKPALWTLIALAIVGGITALWYYLRYRQKKRTEQHQQLQRKAA